MGRLVQSVRAVLIPVLCAVLCSTACGPKQPVKQKKELTTAEKVRVAESMMRAGRSADALNALDEAMVDEPDHPVLHSYKGIVLLNAGRTEEAVAPLQRALELDPYLTDTRNYLGAVYNELGRKDEAEREWLKALEDSAYPSPEKICLNLGALYSSQGRDAEAITKLRRSVEIDPSYHQAHFELANVLERTGRLEEAAREYEVAAAGFRNDGRYYYRLGLTYFRLKRMDQARETLRRAIEVAPGSPAAAEADDLLRMIP